MPGKFDSCKKGAVQSPRATVIFAIGLRALASFASIYSGGLVAVCILRSDVQHSLSIYYVHMAYIPNFNVLHPKVSSGGFGKAFVGLEEQERVAAQAHRVYGSTIGNAAGRHMKRIFRLEGGRMIKDRELS